MESILKANIATLLLHSEGIQDLKHQLDEQMERSRKFEAKLSEFRCEQFEFREFEAWTKEKMIKQTQVSKKQNKAIATMFNEYRQFQEFHQINLLHFICKLFVIN